MPIYSFECDTEKGGCGERFENSFSFREYDEKVKRYLIPCPNCKKRKPIIVLIDTPLYVGVKGGVTLGSLIDKNSDKLSADEKQALHKKHNAYKDEPIRKELPKGMTRGKDLAK